MATEPERTRGVYMISVAAELAGMHPQTLRIYEARGLITPKRSPKNTRLYSQEDVDRLRRIQELTSELGMNLAGVERVFATSSATPSARRRSWPPRSSASGAPSSASSSSTSRPVRTSCARTRSARSASRSSGAGASPPVDGVNAAPV